MNTNDSASENQALTTVIPAKAGIHFSTKADSHKSGRYHQRVVETPTRRTPGGDEGKVFIVDGFDDPLSEFDA